MPFMAYKAVKNFSQMRKTLIYLLQNGNFFGKILVYIMGGNQYSDFLLGYDLAVTGSGQI